MKKIVYLWMSCILMINVASAQKAKVVSAFNYLKSGQLDKAKTNIDEASVHELTMGEAKTWYYRGNVYLAIADSKEDAYKNLDPNPLVVAHESYKKALQYDAKKEYKADIAERMQILNSFYYEIGRVGFNAKDYKTAAEAFNNAKKIVADFGAVDTLATYNAALCAELGKIYDLAITNYLELVNINYKNTSIYTSLASIYKEQKDTAKALQIIQQARVKYPDDYNLLIGETNIYLSTGKTKEANDNLQKALSKDPTNPILYFAVGANHDALGNYTEAEKAYLKAIDLKPDYFDANYNLGALYFNSGVKIFENADKISDMKLYDVEKEKFTAEWNKAIPRLEKALEINASDESTLLSLKQIYARLNMPEKLKIITDKISNLGSGTAPQNKPVPANNSETKTSTPESKGRTYQTGPKGGCYYINENGNKIYVDDSYCK